MKIHLHKQDKITLDIDQSALGVLMLTPPKEKGAPRKLKRLIRIRNNVIRELQAFNKELRRHRVEQKMT